MLSYWAYILIGNDNAGKTDFQKYLIGELCGSMYDKLPSNKKSIITHSQMPRGVKNLFTMGRSYQEKIQEYGDVANFFRNEFAQAEICILSSHAKESAPEHVGDMITELRRRAYNVASVFFSNKYNESAEEISLLGWNERLWLSNPPLKSDAEIQAQIKRRAEEFAQFLIARARLH